MIRGIHCSHRDGFINPTKNKVNTVIRNHGSSLQFGMLTDSPHRLNCFSGIFTDGCLT